MQGTFIRIAAAVILSALTALTTAEAQRKPSTIHGDLVELTTFVRDGLRPTSPSKKEVAIENIKKGGMIAIIERGTNKLYLVAPGANDTAFVRSVSPYMGIPSFIKGPVYTRNSVRVIYLQDIGKSLK